MNKMQKSNEKRAKHNIFMDMYACMFIYTYICMLYVIYVYIYMLYVIYVYIYIYV
jgi:hypothetical protein